jgi:hypothetical protein
MGINLRSIQQVDTAIVEIKDPADGTPLGARFVLAGPTHPERRRIGFAQARKALRAFDKRGRVDMPDPEESEDLKFGNLAAYTLGWEGVDGPDGAPVPFSRAAALDLYRDPTMAWLVDQLDAALGDRELFIKRAATA